MSASLVRWAVRVALASQLILLLCFASGAGVMAVKPGAAASRSEHDVQLTMQARRLLALDRELRPLHLGVRVRDRSATLWGPVPSADLSFRAEVVLRGLVELLEIRNDLWVNSEDGPARATSLPAPPAFLPPPPPPSLPGLPAAVAPPPLPPRAARPAPIPLKPNEVELPPVRLPRSK